MRILLVEDEQDAARMLAKRLREQSFAIDVASHGEDALAKAAISPYDLVILDILMPGKNGFETCMLLRSSGFTSPILILTALGDVEHRISGLDCGADDYLTKPFDFGELLARLRALMRRGPALKMDSLQVADLEIETRARRVKRGGCLVPLTAKEYALLEYLARRAGEVVGRADISEHVWEENYDPFSNLIEVYVQRLRRKIDSGDGPRLLHTRRGEGYMLGLLDSSGA